MNIEDCLPPSLRGPETRVTNMSDGLSGAGVYRIERDDRAFVLKIAPDRETSASWNRALEIRRRAAAAGLTPPLVHADEERRAFVTALVVDRSFAARYRDPHTHDRALTELGEILRRLHAIPLLAAGDSAEGAKPWTQLPGSWATLTGAGIDVPPFVRAAVEPLLTESPPDSARALVLSHNDVHPKNLVHDGNQLYLMDWDAAGPNDPYYDLATIAVFLGMDAPTCRKLLSAYEGTSLAAPLPARFVHDRRLIAALCGVGFLQFGYRSGYIAGAQAASGQTLESAPTLGEFYQRMRAGTWSLATGEGCWAFGLALVRECVTPVE